ncbi:MAG: ATPase [Rhodospirillales bacterium]|nr:ATPase [Rhodospirillales bacterium]
MRKRDRFYAAVGVRTASQGFAIALDDRPVRTPLGRPLILPTEALAQAVGDEWASQGSVIAPATMPLTGIANTAIDRAREDRNSFRSAVAAYGRNDLLCQRADAPADLVRRQETSWGPWLAWAAERYGARLAVGTGVMPVRQPPEAMAALDDAVGALDEWTLAAAGVAVAAGGSLVLALALVEGRIDGGEAFALAVLDETWQNERWGEDREALGRRDAIAADLAAAGRFARLAREKTS